MPICISKPSVVSLRSGMAITPALLIKMSILSVCSFTFSENSWIELLSPRSRGQKCILASLFSLRISLMAYQDFLASLAPKMMVQGLFDSSRMVSFPMPVLAPVITTTCPLRSLSEDEIVPRAHSLKAVRTAKVEEMMMAPCGVTIQFLALVRYSIINYGESSE